MGGSCGSGVTLMFPGNGSRAPTILFGTGAMRRMEMMMSLGNISI
jgi:hypothetical protein